MRKRAAQTERGGHKPEEITDDPITAEKAAEMEESTDNRSTAQKAAELSKDEMRFEVLLVCFFRYMTGLDNACL